MELWDDLEEQRVFTLAQIKYMTETLAQYQADLKELDALIAASAA